MRQIRLFCSQMLVDGLETELETRNNHYLIHVLRVTVGSALILFDGKANEFDAVVNAVSRRAVTVTVQARRPLATSVESPLHTTLAIAISKGDRMDWVMQKATELGVSEIQPLLTRRVEVKLNSGRAEKKLAHWQAVLIGACEQSGRTILPQLNSHLLLSEWLDNLPALSPSEARLTMQPTGTSFNDFSQQFVAVPSRACVLVGPEGGFDEGEIAAAAEAGFVCVRLGERILRTETAPMVALSLLQNRWGDL
jgi:16S rRNA (uracil1498-N3)-methyltransferase